jgi:hypothetical protein
MLISSSFLTRNLSSSTDLSRLVFKFFTDKSLCDNFFYIKIIKFPSFAYSLAFILSPTKITQILNSDHKLI